MTTRILCLLTFLVCVGCQSTKQQNELSEEPKPKTITILVTRANHAAPPGQPMVDPQDAYDIELTVETVDGRMACPRVSRPANEWGTKSDVLDVEGFSYTTAALIGDEMVEIDCEPGMRATMKAVPLEVGYVRVKGMYVYNMLLEDKDISRPATVVPFNVIVKVGEPTVIYDIRMDIDPSSGL